MKNTIEKINKALEKEFAGWHAEPWGEKIAIKDKKNVFIGYVENGNVIAKFVGKKTLMGSLIKNKINFAIKN